MKYRKLPVVIDAVQLPSYDDDDTTKFLDWCEEVGFENFHSGKEQTIVIPTLEGDMMASPTDWIIKGVNGEFYPVKDEIFKKTYELA